MADTTTNTKSRKCKLLNNPLKQRGHHPFNMNLDSEGVAGIMGGMMRKKNKLLFDRQQSMINIEQLDQILSRNNTAPLGMHKKSSTLVDKIESIKGNRTENNRYTSSLQEEPPKLGTYKSVQTLPSQQEFSTPQVKNSRHLNFKPLIDSEKTSYGIFFKNPLKDQHVVEGAMRPDFYKSATPKYLNIGYRGMVSLYERKNFYYKEPNIVRPREYNPTDNFKKRQIMSNSKKYRTLAGSSKDYY